jgi:hypothetical protein
MLYSQSQEYEAVFKSEVHNLEFYQPKEIATGYHFSRYAAAGEHNMYAAMGITPDLFDAMINKIEAVANASDTKTMKTDMGVLIANLRYRRKYPVDQDAALRVAAIYLLMDGENPDVVSSEMIARKLEMCKGSDTAKSDSAMYAFFLNMGLSCTSAWKDLLPTLPKDYLIQRNEALKSLTLPNP